MLTSAYIALNFFQPGIIIAALADFKPMFIASVVMGVSALLNPRVDKMAVLKHPVSLCLIAFVLAQTASVYYGGITSMVQELGFWYIYPVFVFLVAFSINSTDQFRKAVWGLILGGGFVVAYGIYALYSHSTIVLFGIERVRDKAGAYGMYDNHNDYTFLIILILPFIIKLRSIERGFLKRSFLGILAITSVIGVFLSLSRGGIIALLLEVLLIIYFMRKKSLRPILFVLVLIAGIGAIGYQFSMREESDKGTYTAERAQYVRFELWRTGYKMVKARPLLGVGSRRFPEYSPQYTDLSQSNIGLNSHNTYIEVISTSGFIGLLCFAGMLRAILKTSAQKQSQDESLALFREAIIISILTLIVRAFFDAKPHEWGFYMLAAFALVYARLCYSASSKNSQTDGVTVLQ